MIDTFKVIIAPWHDRPDLKAVIDHNGFQLANNQRNDLFVKFARSPQNICQLASGGHIDMQRICFLLHDMAEWPRGTCIAEIELGTLVHGNNNALLSFDEVDNAIRIYVDLICSLFSFLDARTVQVRRADFYYQLQVHGTKKFLRHFHNTWKMRRVRNTYAFGDDESVFIQRTRRSGARIYDKSEKVNSEVRDVHTDFPSGIIRLELSLTGAPLDRTKVFARRLRFDDRWIFDQEAVVNALRNEFAPIPIGRIHNAMEILTGDSKADLIKLLAHERPHLLNAFIERHQSSRSYHRQKLTQSLLISSEGQYMGVPDVETLVTLFQERAERLGDHSPNFVQSYDVGHCTMMVPAELRAIRPPLEHWSECYRPIITDQGEAL